VTYLIQYLGEFEFIFEIILDYESGDQMGSFDAKKPLSKISCLGTFKGVQGDVTGVESRQKKIRADKLYCRKDFFSKFKGTLSREKHKNCFTVLATIELNFLVKFTKSCKQTGSVHLYYGIKNHELRAISYKLIAAMKPWDTSNELEDTRYELRDMRHELPGQLAKTRFLRSLYGARCFQNL
jgi:hypothetical protein